MTSRVITPEGMLPGCHHRSLVTRYGPRIGGGPTTRMDYPMACQLHKLPGHNI